ncbi:hypothetical protein U14_02411 [Candidatus Moduliflexus flocculans]|uniref:Uncharacterized protein n=1 Tax=Candidatus Moduliflexus flocculans TaxID=1499966 RepID=A0A081BLA3_9BACT|nr:hypothetical protein U14_02411 [Candidatus Moduliflexus flocculans]
MAHDDAGHYKHKHPEETMINALIAEQLQARAKDGRINCAAAHQIARELGVTPEEVGVTADLLELRINQCQLGLFGHGHQKRLIFPAKEVSAELRQAIEAALDDDGLACDAAWRIAEQFTITRVEVSSACETLHIRIKACQLGAFNSKKR